MQTHTCCLNSAHIFLVCFFNCPCQSPDDLSPRLHSRCQCYSFAKRPAHLMASLLLPTQLKHTLFDYSAVLIHSNSLLKLGLLLETHTYNARAAIFCIFFIVLRLQNTVLSLYTLNTQYSLVDSLILVDKSTSALPFPFFPELT